MAEITVALKDGGYKIEIGCGNLFQTACFKDMIARDRYAIVTDSNVGQLYGERLLEFLKKQGLKAELLPPLPPGEESKTLETAGKLGGEMARRGFDRYSILIALGGGVIGDVVGESASSYMRGIGHIQVPTTLLSQVDSSVGGKTNLNLPEGKNLWGHFHQPQAVIIDVAVLRTLPEREVRNGLAEVIRSGMVWDAPLFEDVEKNHASRDDQFYLRIVEKSCRIKAEIVELDEKEYDIRQVLNYGHTVGHAAEAVSGYRISHGEGLGLGMACEGRVSSRLRILPKADLERQNELIRNVGFPVNYDGDPDKLIEQMRRDKKSRGGKINFVLARGVGSFYDEPDKVVFPIPESLIRECLKG